MKSQNHKMIVLGTAFALLSVGGLSFIFLNQKKIDPTVSPFPIPGAQAPRIGNGDLTTATASSGSEKMRTVESKTTAHTPVITNTSSTGSTNTPAAKTDTPSREPAAPLSEVQKIRQNGSGCVLAQYELPASERSIALHAINQIKLKDTTYNPKTLCVRVDGTAVKFKLAKNEISISALPNVNSAVTVRYCLGKTTCSETCAVAKDEFMEALTGEDQVSDHADEQTAQWNAENGPSKEDEQVERELQAFKTHLQKIDESKKTVSTWNLTKESEACTAPRNASNQSSTSKGNI